MATLDLLLGEKQFRNVIGVLELDATISETHELEATVSKNPIENGSDITDNVRLQPRSLSIEGMITETPITLLGSAFGLFTGASFAVGETILGPLAGQALAAGTGSLAGLISNRNEDDADFKQKAYDYLKELWRNRVPFTVVTTLERYENMVISKLSVPKSIETGRALRFTATFEEVQIVQTLTAVVTENNVKNPGSADKQSLGKQPTTEASAGNTESASVLFNAFDSATSALGA